MRGVSSQLLALTSMQQRRQVWGAKLSCGVIATYWLASSRTQEGWTPLHVAAFHDSADVIGIFLKDTRLDVRKSAGVSLRRAQSADL